MSDKQPAPTTIEPCTTECVVALEDQKHAAEDATTAARSLREEARAYVRRMTPAGMAAVTVPKRDNG